MADLLHSIQSELHARLQELRPLALEAQRLEAALAALDVPHGKGTPERRPRSRARREPSKKRAPRGQNKRLIFAAINAKPEATVSDLHEATGIDKPVVYNITRKGLEDGELDKVSLAGGIQGFKTKSAENVTKRPKPTRRGSRGKRSARTAAAAAPELDDSVSQADEQPSEPDKPAA